MCTSGATVIGVLPIMRVQGTETFDSIAAGTRVWWSLQLEPCGVFKLMAPQLVRELGQRLDTAFATLKRLLETQQVPQEDGRVGVASDIS
jgi:hypothetical protein